MSTKQLQYLEFGCLAIDTDGSCVFGNDINRFFEAIKSNIVVFPDPLKISANATEKDLIANTANSDITLSLNKLPNDSPNIDYTVGYYLVVRVAIENNVFLRIDPIRIDIINHLVNLKFGKIFIVKDDLSSKLLGEVYNQINKVENLLRSYLTKNFVLTDGAGYASTQIFDNSQKKKANDRKSNEDIFSKLSEVIDTKIYLVDFGDLGDIIYSSSLGNQSIDDVLGHISKAENLEELKTKAQKYSEKYFKNFKAIDFLTKWNYLKNIRHKVAHNGLTRVEEIEISKKYLTELCEFLEVQNNSIIKAQVFDNFQDIEKTVYNSNIGSKVIDRNQLLNELNNYKKRSEIMGRTFFGLKNFLYNIIAAKGYKLGEAWSLLEELEAERYIEITQWEDPEKKFPNQKQIIFKKDIPVYSG